MLDHRSQPVRVFFLVQIPVAKCRAIVVAATEPTVINDKAFYAKSGRLGGHLHDVLGLVVEIDALPGIEMHGTWLVFREVQDILADITVKLLAERIQTRARAGSIQPRRT
ncbi:hypothetical protein D3C80_1681730 [compost metagenome]